MDIESQKVRMANLLEQMDQQPQEIDKLQIKLREELAKLERRLENHLNVPINGS